MFRGTLLHRTWLCRATEELRVRSVPKWLRDEVCSKLAGGAELRPGDLLLYTRALLPSLRPAIPKQSSEASFHWVVKPREANPDATTYVDGSLLHSAAKYAGLAEAGKLVAAAGQPPGWA